MAWRLSKLVRKGQQPPWIGRDEGERTTADQIMAYITSRRPGSRELTSIRQDLDDKACLTCENAS